MAEDLPGENTHDDASLFPPELILAIFSQLDPISLCRIIRPLSKSWSKCVDLHLMPFILKLPNWSIQLRAETQTRSYITLPLKFNGTWSPQTGRAQYVGSSDDFHLIWNRSISRSKSRFVLGFDFVSGANSIKRPRSLIAPARFYCSEADLRPGSRIQSMVIQPTPLVPNVNEGGEAIRVINCELGLECFRYWSTTSELIDDGNYSRGSLVELPWCRVKMEADLFNIDEGYRTEPSARWLFERITMDRPEWIDLYDRSL